MRVVVSNQFRTLDSDGYTWFESTLTASGQLYPVPVTKFGRTGRDATGRVSYV